LRETCADSFVLLLDEDPEEEKERQKQLTEEYKPLLDWIKKETKDIVRNGECSDTYRTEASALMTMDSRHLKQARHQPVRHRGGHIRLHSQHGKDAQYVLFSSTPSCRTALTALRPGAQNQNDDSKRAVHDFAKRMKILEINPRSPLIEGLLKRVAQLPPDDADDAERDPEAEAELREVASVLIDGALVRSGFAVPDSHAFFSRVDRILRRSLGVSEAAQADARVRPAPPVAPVPPAEDDELGFEDTHVPVDPDMFDPEALGLKMGKPVFEDEAFVPREVDSLDGDGDEEENEQKHAHDEL
jgi:heat shock protein 90kDa beta